MVIRNRRSLNFRKFSEIERNLYKEDRFSRSMEQEIIMRKIETLEKELDSLKELIVKKKKPEKKSGSLKGILKGMKITEEEIEAAKITFHDECCHRCA